MAETNPPTKENAEIASTSLVSKDKPKGKSRFKVAKVEFLVGPDEHDGAENGESKTACDEPKQTKERGQGENNKDPQSRLKGDVGTPRIEINGPRKRQDSVQSSASEKVTDLTSPPYSPNNATDTYHRDSDIYDTQACKTLGRNTLETLPHADHYRNLLSATGAMRKRPTLLELHEQEDEDQLLAEVENGHVHSKSPCVVIEDTKPPVKAVKFGWITGVLVRCLLNIYGVMLFLRLSWVVGQAGIGLSSLIILLATVVTIITSLSMAAICSNGQVRAGGAYYMISRSLGPEFGGAIGLIFSTANAVAVAMYVVGFAETIRDILKEYNCLMVDEINDVRIIGTLTIMLLFSIAIIGMEWESRAQLALLAILVIAICNFMIGTFIPPRTAQYDKGFVGYQGTVFSANFGPDFRDDQNFFSVFAIFFPAATGILAGANISGDLQDAQKAIPKGTLWAILISTLTYIAMAWMAGACALRDAGGPLFSAVVGDGPGESSNTTLGYQLVTMVVGMVTTTSPMGNLSGLALGNTTSCVPRVDCKYGLQNDMQVMQVLSVYGPITIAGIISATLSSALASLVSAPKVFQAVCKDKIFPGIHVFAKGYGAAEEPRRAYVLAFFVALGFICVGELNAIAPLISNFFLMSYALLNYSCFDASLAKSPGWRPAFRYYSMWLSLLGAIICLAVMFLISWWTALITFGAVSALYVSVHYRKPDINWGSSTQAHVYKSALTHTLKLVRVLEHVKNYRPQVLVMTEFPKRRPALVDFAYSITKNISLMMCGDIVQCEPSDKLREMRGRAQRAYNFLAERKVRSFYNGIATSDFRAGAQSLLQCSGTGKMKPNTFLLGFKSNWKVTDPQEVEAYVNIIHDAFDLHFGVGILRVKQGFDYYKIAKDYGQPVDEVPRLHTSACGYLPSAIPSTDPLPSPSSVQTVVAVDEMAPLHGPIPDAPDPDHHDNESDEEKEAEEAGKQLNGKDGKQEVLNCMNLFRQKHKGNIDVWWLFDDGGLTLLLPYILTTQSQWRHCKLRVYMGGSNKEFRREERNMANLLNKFRIEYSSMKVITDIGKRPQEENVQRFKSMIAKFMMKEDEGETEESHPWKISENDYLNQKDKTYRHIRLRELLQQHSSDAALIVVTLPMPRKGLCSSGLYMAWLDTLTTDMPPILLLRGNQESVLTYYS